MALKEPTFMKVFSFKSFPLYGRLQSVTIVSVTKLIMKGDAIVTMDS